MPSKPCVLCEKWLPIFANKMCAACFVEWSAGRNIPIDQMPVHCGADGCIGYAVKKGLCDKHYRRLHDHGTTEKIKQISEERRHPEQKNWYYKKAQGKLCERWQNFWNFVNDIGDRPSPRHWLEAKDANQLLGPDNFYWREPQLEQKHSANTIEGRREYQRAVRAKEPDYWVGSNLKRYFGLTRDGYDAILAAQGGVCAICKGKETSRRKDGSFQLFAVDHDHETGEIRGLLCVNCNQMLGQARDRPEILLAGACYLEQKNFTGLFIPSNEVRKNVPLIHRAAHRGNCAVDGCDGIAKAHGYCPKHYGQFLRGTQIGVDNRIKNIGPCSIPGCDRSAQKRGYCSMHYQELRTKKKISGTKICSIAGCQETVVGRGMCRTHHARWIRYGDANALHDTQGRLISASPNAATPSAPIPSPSRQKE